MTDNILIDRAVVEQALGALVRAELMHRQPNQSVQEALRAALEQPKQTLKDAAMKAGITISDTYIPSMEDAIAAGDSVLINEQATLLRECRLALNSLIKQKPTLAGLRCGSTTLGNLKADLYAYRPRGVMGTSELEKPQVEQETKSYKVTGKTGEFCVFHSTEVKRGDMVYTHPQPPRQPLTDDEIEKLFPYTDAWLYEIGLEEATKFARSIEAAHGIGGEA